MDWMYVALGVALLVAVVVALFVVIRSKKGGRGFHEGAPRATNTDDDVTWLITYYFGSVRDDGRFVCLATQSIDCEKKWHNCTNPPQTTKYVAKTPDDEYTYYDGKTIVTGIQQEEVDDYVAKLGKGSLLRLYCIPGSGCSPV